MLSVLESPFLIADNLSMAIFMVALWVFKTEVAYRICVGQVTNESGDLTWNCCLCSDGVQQLITDLMGIYLTF